MQKLSIEKEFQGNSPTNIFVSWNNYPKISVAPLSSTVLTNDVELFDNPEKWFGLSKKKILSFRQQLIRSTRRMHALSAANPNYELTEMQELVMADKPVEVKVNLKNRLNHNIEFSNFNAPLGPKADLEKLSIISNLHIPKKVDYLISDTDAKSQTAIMELFNYGLPVHYLHKILSIGTLGVKKDRKLVPTRWSITAVDSNISKELIDEKIKYFPTINEFRLFTSSYLDNHFYVLLFPSSWQFEVMEVFLSYSDSPKIISDNEFYGGRKTYAENVAGGYYAARLAVAEHLLEEKKQAGCVIFREIGSSYKQSLGVWQVRENMRNSFKQKPISFSSLDLALSYLKQRLTIKMENYLKESVILNELKHQKKIISWMKS